MNGARAVPEPLRNRYLADGWWTDDFLRTVTGKIRKVDLRRLS